MPNMHGNIFSVILQHIVSTFCVLKNFIPAWYVFEKKKQIFGDGNDLATLNYTLPGQVHT